jgi:DMSO reductase family type II enzyme heme b subunit
MEAKKLDATTEDLLNPASPRWARVKRQVISLEGTPVQLQPSRYIRAKWSDRPTGAVRALTVRPAHNGRQLFLHLEWRDETPNRDYSGRAFPDAAAILFPVNGDAPLQTMGSPEAPVNAWYWRADDEAPHDVVATGLGTITETGYARLLGRGLWKNGLWRVVLGRSLRGPRAAGTVRFRSGQPTKVAFAVWEGDQSERGGIKAFSNRWQDLTLGR